MTATASTITILVALVVIVGAQFALLRDRIADLKIDQQQTRDEVKSELREARDELAGRLDRIEQTILADHGERITRLEERTGARGEP